jgi:glycosyltransferase involved in cell wall biosynthesis
MCRDRGLAARVRFHGQLDRAGVADAYRRAGIMVLPSLADGLPNVVLEAMASGLAVITTRTGAAEVIRDNGIVIESPDATTIQSAVERYLDDPALLIRHQRNSRRLAEAMPWRAVADLYVSMYREVLAQPGRSPVSRALLLQP